MHKVFKWLLALFCGAFAISTANASFVYVKNEATGNGGFVVDDNLTVKAYNVTQNKKYTSIERSLETAVANDIIYAVPPEKDNYNDKANAVIPDKVEYTITRDCVIKEGVTFIVPTDKRSISGVNSANSVNSYVESLRSGARTYGSDSSYGAYAINQQNKYLRITINVADNVTITNKGNLIISGYTSSGKNQPGSIGHVAHSYSKIVLGHNSKIIQSSANANTHCFGFIEESSLNNGSEFLVNQGNLHIPFVVSDYKGFNVSFAMTGGAIDNERCSPFNRFIFPNISTLLKLSYSSKVESYASIWAKYNNPSFDKVFPQKVPLVGNTNTYVFQFTDQSYSSLNYKYNPTTQVAKVDFYGGLALNNFSMNIKESIVSIDLNTVNSYFPISYQFDINLFASAGQSQAIYDFTKQRIKFLPGSKIKINQNTLVSFSEIGIYTALYDNSAYQGKNSPYSGSSYYPLKPGAEFVIDGGLINGTTIGGTVYGLESNITASNTQITCKEPWTLKSSGALNPPWTITDFLEIREKLTVVPIENLNKQKLYAGFNIYSVYGANTPSYKIKMNFDSTTAEKTVSNFQEVIFLDSALTSYQIDFISNIYKMFTYSNGYLKNQTIKYNANTSIMCGVNSHINISNNNNGINEFNAQSVTLECTTPLVEGKIPLYIDSVVNLKATVVDYEKIYDKTITFNSLNPDIATVNSDGEVTGKALGTVRIEATCDGVTGFIDLQVIEKQNVKDIQEVFITDDKGGSSKVVKGTNNDTPAADYNNNYGNNTDVTFTINIVPSDAPYGSIVWTFKASSAGRQYVNDITQSKEIIENQTSIVVHVVKDSGKSDDTARLSCEVTGLDGTVHTSNFVLSHNADACLERGSLVLLANGKYKPIELLKPEEEVMAFNHNTGSFEATKMIGILNHGMMHGARTSLEFSDGKKLSIIGAHELFDYTLRKYVSINSTNYKDYLYHDFVVYDDKAPFSITKLVNASVNLGYFESYTIETFKNMNLVVGGLITATPVPGLSNYFELDSELKYIPELMNRDIEYYGLYTYEDWSDVMPEVMFDGINAKYFKVSIGKGLTSYDTIYRYAKKAMDFAALGELAFNKDLLILYPNTFN